MPPQPPPVKASKVWIWLALWFLLGGLFLGMLYLLFFVPVPKLKPNSRDPLLSQPLKKGPGPPPKKSGNSRFVPPIPRDRKQAPAPTPRAPQAGVKERWVSIQTTPSRVLVYLGSSLLGKTPLKKKLKVGKHRLRLRKSGYRSRSVSLEVSATEEPRPLRVRLYRYTRRSRRPTPRPRPRAKTVKPRAPAKKAIGFLTVKGSPLARIYVNGIDTNSELLYRHKLPAGTYKLHFVTKDGDVWEHRVKVTAGKETNLISRFKKKK